MGAEGPTILSMKPFEVIEHTADIGIKAYAKTLKELFVNAAKGMFEVIAGKGQRAKGKERRKVKVKKEVDGFEELLVDWLSELLYLFNKEEILFCNFQILELNNNGLVGEASGEKIDPSRYTLQTEIKAVTFHGLNIEEDKNGFSCKIIFDV